MRFFKYFLLHKWYVFLAGVRLGGIPIWSLIWHDMSKLLHKDELDAFYEKQAVGIQDKGRVARGWVSHQNRNKHHYEYWIIAWNGSEDYYDIEAERISPCVSVLPMPEVYIREMIADWHGASKVYTHTWDFSAWLTRDWPNMIFHSHTEHRVREVLGELKYRQLEEGKWIRDFRL